ncbi:acetyltransferase (GNAT) family protein [Streptomyces sp. 3211.6]|uniref:GNAT family N-acetyltransferase n=1 Tax=Streptomyces TaxID=1883 RepID=UPI0009A4978A|nr:MULTISPECIES: GNAT family N-acetyltransferase [Streptomyces]RKT03255.1 acetyltransferase (GNAT) family protein [Streptomyces sp. 3211.6]RPF29324.1 acetyltransferase (GNAT) family protein [Streptomyces sp. Ag109_G2-6]
MHAYTPLELRQLTRPEEVTPELRKELAGCWEEVVNSGGAVIAAGFPLPPVDRSHVAPVVDGLVRALDPALARMLVAVSGGALAGWLVVRRERHPLIAHRGTVNHVQTLPRLRGQGIATALMHRVAEVARAEMGLERLEIAVRGGLGLEGFYRGLGWAEVGRWPGALRVAPGDDRDEILMTLVL